jgi:hypothetical protein
MGACGWWVSELLESYSEWLGRWCDVSWWIIDWGTFLVISNDISELWRRKGQSRLIEETESPFNFRSPVLARKGVGRWIGVARSTTKIMNLEFDVVG